MHPSYGFQHSLFEPDFQMTEQIGWGLNDHDFLQQMVPRIEKLPRPFAAWLITLSLHHPFESFPDAHKVLKLGALEGTSFGNYLHTMRFFDQALEDFRTALARDGLLDDSVIVVFGDHDAGFAQGRVAGADDRHRHRRRGLDAQRSRAAVYQGRWGGWGGVGQVGTQRRRSDRRARDAGRADRSRADRAVAARHRRGAAAVSRTQSARRRRRSSGAASVRRLARRAPSVSRRRAPTPRATISAAVSPGRRRTAPRTTRSRVAPAICRG